MTKKHGISRLLHDLQELYCKLFAMDLSKHMSLYHRNTDTNEAPDNNNLTAFIRKLHLTSLKYY